MTKSELINEILSEWAYRVDDGQPNPNNKKHLAELSIVLSEMGLLEIKNELFQNLKEAESKQFTNPILNKEIPYTAKDGSKKTGIVGNLLRLPKDNPGRIEAEKMLPANPDEKDAAMQDLGSEKDGKSTGGEIPTAEKPKDGEKPQSGAEQPKEDPIKAAQAMFDPKADPAMGARLDREKAAADKIVQKDKDDADAEKSANASTNDETPADTFTPIDAKEVNTEMPQADPETFGGGSDIPDGIQPEELHQFNTDIKKVAQIVAKAKENNQPIPDINLCDITVPGTNLYCDDNLGIPRDEMPQFKGKATAGSRAASMEVDKDGEVDTEPIFRKMLDDKGIKVLQTEVPADKLKATQKDLVGGKVIGMMGALEKDPQHPKITAPIYVSRDGYVIDGHHRWAAIVAYNAQHPDNQIPMKTTVLDMDIKDAIPMANKFAEDMGIAAKKADANKEDTTQSKAAEVKPNETDPNSNVKTFKGESSGKEIKTVELEGGGFLFGTQHGDTKMADDIINQVKASIPKERWKDIVFVGEGGATGDSGELEFNDEMEYSAPKFKEMGASIDTWDGDELDVHNDQSDLYKSQEEQTGLSQSKIKAGNWASMIGQGEGTDTMSTNDFLDDEGKQFLEQSAKEAGFSPIENWDNPTEQDIDTLYRLSFPEDNGDTETGVNTVQVAFNKARDLNLIKKQKELAASGKIPVVMAGESHTDLVDDIMKGKKEEPISTEKLPEPKKPSEKDGGVVYSLGGGYYSDTPKGPAQYVTTESVVERVLVEGDESWAYMLFEAVVTKKTAKGKTVKLKTIEPKNQKKATVAAKAKKEKPTGGESQTTNPYAQPGQQIKEPKQVKNLMANDTKKVLSALHKTKEQEQAEKEAAKKAGKKLGVGAGTAASRAGECAVVSGGKMLTDAIAKGIPFDKAIKSVEDMLRKVANNPDTLLDNEWVNSAITTLTYINNSIGFDKISQFTWDTDEGRAVVGSEGHGTSSDCFMLLKDGTRLGLSLKKDLNVFVFSGGMGDMMKDLESQGMQGLPTLEDYKNRRSEEMSKIDVFARNKKTHDEFCKDFNNLRLHPDTRFEAKGLSNRLASIQKNTKKSLKSLSCDEFINSVVSNPKGDNIKILADMCKTSNVPALKQIYKNTRGLDREMTDKVTTNFIDPKNKAVVNELVRRETHIDDILFPNNEHLDKLMVVYGEDPAIEMKKENLIGLLNIGQEYAAYHKEKNPAKKIELKKALDEKINSQIKVTNKGGVMSVGIDIGKSIIPIFEARVRTRGIGNAPTFEMPQSRFGGLAFKNGTTNFREWKDPKDRIDVVTSMSKELMDDMDDLDLTDQLTQTEILGRIARLKAILPDGAKNKTLNKALLQLKAAGIEPK